MHSIGNRWRSRPFTAPAGSEQRRCRGGLSSITKNVSYGAFGPRKLLAEEREVRTLLSLLRIPEHLDARVLVERHALVGTRNDAADAEALLLALDVVLGRKVEGDCAATNPLVSKPRRGSESWRRRAQNSPISRACSARVKRSVWLSASMLQGVVVLPVSR